MNAEKKFWLFLENLSNNFIIYFSLLSFSPTLWKYCKKRVIVRELYRERFRFDRFLLFFDSEKLKRENAHD